MSDKIFEPNTFKLLAILDNAYDVPSYQRPYSWKNKEHVQVLLDDIYNAFEMYMVNTTETYYTGPFYYNYKETLRGGKERYSIIDGQQRLTTLNLILSYFHTKQ